MATAANTPKPKTPRKRTTAPKADSSATAAKVDNKAEPAAAKPAPKARPRRAPKAAAPATKTKAPSGLGKSGIAAIIAATGLGAIGALAFGILRSRRTPAGDPGTTPTDLMGDRHPDGSQRAIEQFRPDPTASIPDSERDAFRPALAGAAAPTLVAGQASDLRRLDAAPS